MKEATGVTLSLFFVIGEFEKSLISKANSKKIKKRLEF
jgi:hypothetical protein